jgi:hypothetical protein
MEVKKMKTLSRKAMTIAFFLMILLCLSVIAVYATTITQTRDPAPGLLYIPIFGQEVTLAQAQSTMPIAIKLPTKLGEVAEFKFDISSKILTAVYSTTKPAADANFIDVINANAIVLIQCPSNLTIASAQQNILDAINSTKNDIGGGLQAVSINGYMGCEGGNVFHTVSWYTETAYYRLAASLSYPLQNLVETAISMQK